MKKTILLFVWVLILLVWGFYTFDAYLCSHLYYWWSPFLSCTWWQGKWLDMLWNSSNRWTVGWGLFATLAPILYLIFAKKISLRNIMLTFFAWAVIYIVWMAIFKDSLFWQWFLIMVFNITLLFLLLYWLITTMTVLGSKIFQMVKWHMGNSMHDIFLKFTLWLIVFCFANVLLLQLHLFYGIIIFIEFFALTYLIIKNKAMLHGLTHNIESFVAWINDTFKQNQFTYILYIIITALGLLYAYMWLNLAYIPYPTAWDANHAYIFIPRMWALNNGIYWGNAWVAGAVPYLWYWFLTFWFKFASALPWTSWLFGISPDTLTIIMNFWSWPFVLLSSGFTLHAILTFISWSSAEKKDQKAIMWCLLLWLLFVIVWLTSGMWAFLVFVDNKTDLSVLFFTVIAIYSGIQFLIALKDNTYTKYTKHYAILSWLFFAASALAKPTGMFDIMHFAILFFIQWNWILLAIGGYITILWGLGLSKLLLVSQFLTTTQSYYLIGIWLITTLIGFIPTMRKKFRLPYLRYFLIWIATIVSILVIYKWPFALVQQFKKDWTVDLPGAIRTILLWKTDIQTNNKVLLASTISEKSLAAIEATGNQSTGSQSTGSVVQTTTRTPDVSIQQCVASVWSTDLYANLKSANNDGATEDLGRYIWYGQKVFKDIAVLAWIPNWCYSIYQDARWLCPQLATIKDWKIEDVIDSLQPYKDIPWSNVGKWISSLNDTKDEIALKKIRTEIASYVESNTLIVSAAGIGIPYKLLVPFNITFNWSLQNLSSYYTDIWIIRLLWLFLSLLWIVYWIATRNKILVGLSVITVWSWAIWWVVGSAILWYSLWLIIWTIVWVIVLVYSMLHSYNKKNEIQSYSMYIIIWLLVLWGLIQLMLNLVRIASQWAWWPFTWYKANVWEKYIFSDQLMADKTVKIWFNASDVLDLQFPHYKWIIDTLNKRQSDEGVVVAGTYLQYFIDNQSNVQSDGFLSIFWENISDNDVCKSYLRLKDQKKKYLIIDPNIASVVMGDWNKTLFDRFYAVVWADGKLQQHGTLSMLQALVQWGYLKLASTNNIITKYAFILPDDQLWQLLSITDKDELLLARAKMTAARFFPNSDVYGNIAIQVFANRVASYEALSDISDVIGKPIREDVVVWVAKYVDAWVKQEQYAELQKKIQDLTQDERTVLQQYFAFKKAQKENPQQFRQYVISLVSQSINNWSQVIALTVQ